MAGDPTGERRRPANGLPDDDAVILEFTRIGATIRVAALDPATLTEVVIQGPAAAGEAALRAAALRKLAYVLERRRRAKRG
jgi:hypothetical protein